MIGVEADRDPRVVLCDGVNARDDGGVDGGTLDHVDALRQGVGLDGRAVVTAEDSLREALS